MTLGTESRDERAREILAHQELWSPVYNRDGSGLAWCIPSLTTPNLVYLATHETCTCRDAQRGNLCKHSRAVREHALQFAAHNPELVARAERELRHGHIAQAR